MTVVDLRIEYEKETGDRTTPIDSAVFTEVDYVQWLEEKLLEVANKNTLVIHGKDLIKTLK